jgi:hypothetical protein
MAQIKGKTGNPNGRPRGTPNKVTTDLRTWISDLLDSNRLQIAKDIEQLEPQQRVMIFEKLLSYVVPKIQSVEAKVDLNRLTDEQLDGIIVELSKQVENDE